MHAGHRRWKACQRANMQSVPCLVLDGELTEEQALQITLVENLQRENLEFFEELRIIKRLKDDFQLTNQQIGSRVGLSDLVIADYILISERLPAKVIKRIVKTKGGKASPRLLTVSKAILLSQANLEEDKLAEILEHLKHKGFTQKLLAKRLAGVSPSKLKRVVQSRTFWRELTKSLKQCCDCSHAFADYWADYATLKEWEDVKSYHLELKVTLPKDLAETKV